MVERKKGTSKLHYDKTTKTIAKVRPEFVVGQDNPCDVCGTTLRWQNRPFPQLSGPEPCPLHDAAPDLLAALEACLRNGLYEGEEFDSNGMIRLGTRQQKRAQDITAQARAAIAKAKGG